MGSRMKFANIYYKRSGRYFTIGDDIQLLAIENLYNYMGIDYDSIVRIGFHELSSYDGEYVILPISFPLYSYQYDDVITGFSDKIIPVFLNVSIMSTYLSEIDIEYFKKFAPIGCRDEYTLRIMRSYNIKAYLNGCITLTFPRVREKEDMGYSKVYCVDVPDRIKGYIPSEILKNSIFTSHTYKCQDVEGMPEELAREVYSKYIKEAKMVITTRLHAALPCVAAGIPVVFLKDNFSFRFTGIDKVITIYDEDEYNQIDWMPKLIECDDIKDKVLANAARQLFEAYEKNSSIYEVSQFFEGRTRRPYYVEFVDNTIEYLNKHWDKNIDIEYALWCGTQTATEVYRYIKESYPNAKLKAIIDRNKKVILDMETKEISWIKENADVFVFVCAAAAIGDANKIFKEMKKENYYLCCLDDIGYK